MHKKKSTLCVYITLLLLGIFNSIAAAQIVEPATNLSPQTGDATTVHSPKSLAETETDSQTETVGSDHTFAQGEHTPRAQGETDLPSQEIEPGTAPTSKTTPVRSLQSVGEIDHIPRTLKEAGWLPQTTKPATVSTDSSEAHAPSLIPETSSLSLQVTQLEQEQTAPTAEPSSPPEPAQTEPDSPPPEQFIFTPRAGLRYTGEGAGFGGFTSVEGFFPLSQKPGRNLTYSDLRLHIFNNGTLGGNATVGHRIYLPASKLTVGGYISYDNRDTENSFFNQIGAGLEALSESWDFRLNGYFPVGDNRSFVNKTLADTPRFSQNVLLLDFNQKFEAAMTGFDLEAGGVIPIAQAGYVRPFAGTYYYNAEGSEGAWGIRGGLSYYSDYLQASVAVQDDRIFDTQVVFKVGINFPSSAPRSRVKPPTALARMGESVVRQAAITVEDQEIRSQETALNPATGQPWFFQHVALGNSGGNGTFESPFGTVENGLNATRSDGNDIVYVQPGTNPGINGFTIRDRVQVLSTGPGQPLDTEQLGNIQLPLSGAGVLPEVTGSVTLGNDTTISGFAFNNSPEDSIQGRNLSNVTIRDNRITDPVRGGINLRNVTGDVSITGNTVSHSRGIPSEMVTFDTNGVPQRESCGGLCNLTTPFNADLGISGGSSGIRLFNDSGDVNLTISRNTVSNAVSSGIFVGSADTAQVSANVTDNTANQNQGSGIFLVAVNNAQLTATIANNSANNNQGRIFNESGIRFATFDNAKGTATLNNNTINGNLGNGIFFGINDNSEATGTLTNNTANDNTGDGIFFGSRVTSRATGVISGNTTIGNRANPDVIPSSFPTGHGIFFGAQESAQMTATVTNNTANSNQQSGIFFLVANNGRGTATITNNIVNDNQASGIQVDVGIIPGGPPGPPPPPVGTVQGVLTVADNMVSGNLGIGPPGMEGAGITILSFNNATFQVAVERNMITNNASAPGALGGLSLLSLDNSQLLAGVRFNTLTNNTVIPAFSAQSVPPSKLCLQLSSNTSDTGFGLIRVSPASTFQADTAGNTGPIIVPVVPVAPLGDCVVP